MKVAYEEKYTEKSSIEDWTDQSSFEQAVNARVSDPYKTIPKVFEELNVLRVIFD